jgi:hypothetical protein
MKFNKTVQSIINVLLLIVLSTSCRSAAKSIEPTTIIDPPARSTPLTPTYLSESEILSNTFEAFLTGNRDFWDDISYTAYPVLHPSFESREFFIEAMIEYSELYDFSCQNVLRHPAIVFTDWDGAEEITLVFAGIPLAGEEAFQNSGTPNAISIFEVTYLTNGDDPPAYYLYRYGFAWSEGDSIEENYESFLNMRKQTVSKYNLDLTIAACP